MGRTIDRIWPIFLNKTNPTQVKRWRIYCAVLAPTASYQGKARQVLKSSSSLSSVLPLFLCPPVSSLFQCSPCPATNGKARQFNQFKFKVSFTSDFNVKCKLRSPCPNCQLPGQGKASTKIQFLDSLSLSRGRNHFTLLLAGSLCACQQMLLAGPPCHQLISWSVSSSPWNFFHKLAILCSSVVECHTKLTKFLRVKQNHGSVNILYR